MRRRERNVRPMWSARGTMAAALATAAASAVTVSPVARAASPARWRLWRVARDGAGARPLDMEIDVTATSASSLVFVAGVRGNGAARRVINRALWEGGGSDVTVYKEGTVTSACQIGGGCDDYLKTRLVYAIGSTDPVRDVYYVLTWAADPHITFATKGWRSREVAPATHVTRVLATATGSTGVHASGSAIERYSGAVAPGGAEGSIAWASLPCSAVGTGSGRLVATPAPRPTATDLDCEDAPDAAVIADARVTWRVTADATGMTSDAPSTRLLVLDLPK